MEFEKNLLVIFLLFMFAAPNYAHPSIYSSTTNGVINGITTTTESPSLSRTITSGNDTTSVSISTTKSAVKIKKKTTTTSFLGP
uniref:Uncharacterized protein n=1 Tax=Panagrolaimus superbus TaxID=310955 RepID=A0A914Y464_9BILA